MKRLILLLTLLFTDLCIASLPSIKLDVHDQASLQNGAELFMRYCHGCHSLEFQRYNVTARDIGIADEATLKENLIQTGSYSTRDGEYHPAKTGDLMFSAMSRKDAALWFGVAPPDLSTIVRAKGAQYIFAYLNTFYLDPARPAGVNNLAFPNAGMPHVLIELQGIHQAVTESKLPAECTTADNSECKPIQTVIGTKLIEPGSMTEMEYHKATSDIVNFLAYVAEPAQLKRAQIGPWVIGFLVIFTMLAYCLNREYWKDVK